MRIAPLLVLALAACRAAPVGPASLPEGVAPGERSPVTDREASRSPADRDPPEPESAPPRVRDERGIPIPAYSDAARARTGSSNPPPSEGGEEGEGAGEGAGEGGEAEPIANPDEGEAAPEGEGE